MDLKNQYLSDVWNQTASQFLTYVILTTVWGFGIPLAFGVLGSSQDAGLGLTVVTSATAFGLLTTGFTAVNRYRLLNMNLSPEAMETAVGQSESKQPFTFFLATITVLTAAILVGHLLILN
ncbi:MAG: hypothetical protein O3C16_02460 [Actinobacteria bacterium]|nr:hypothetical protein [Actinomycetota bacterium]MDA2985527.1 hypothetical protein [Actinomycetota bacterium]